MVKIKLLVCAHSTCGDVCAKGCGEIFRTVRAGAYGCVRAPFLVVRNLKKKSLKKCLGARAGAKNGLRVRAPHITICVQCARGCGPKSSQTNKILKVFSFIRKESFLFVALGGFLRYGNSLPQLHRICFVYHVCSI